MFLEMSYHSRAPNGSEELFLDFRMNQPAPKVTIFKNISGGGSDLGYVYTTNEGVITAWVGISMLALI